ncbi:MAG TPA: hypothetical protein VG165_00955 [Solirubrobacteraceae bacterium]|jgi:hypothetical protein|nr:hypothetical protein [Solirubrobacteraceae bacterium]
MLFDLRGRGKRRTIQAIYLFLAVLLGGGLIFFGIGGGGSGGGLLNAVGQNGGGGSNVFQNELTAAKKRVGVAPTDAAAWAALTNAQYEVAASGDGYDTTTESFTAKGKAELAQARTSWNKYLSLNPKTPDATVASEMVRAFEPAQLNLPADAVSAQEIVVGQNPTSPDAYATLAVLAYLASQSRKGDLAAAKAVSLEPKASQVTLKAQLATDKVQAAAEVAAAAKQASGVGTTATLPGG